MSYGQVKDLRPADFKRYYGAQPGTFRKMTGVVSARLAKGRRKRHGCYRDVRRQNRRAAGPTLTVQDGQFKPRGAIRGVGRGLS